MKFYNALSTYFASRLDSAETLNLSSVLEDVITRFGWANVTYLGSGFNGSELGEDVLITTYENDWIARYNQQNYKYIDPVVSRSSQSLLPIDWGQIELNSREIRTFFGEAQELGVGKAGLTVSVRGLCGDSSIFSINTHDAGSSWELRKAEILCDLTYFAHLFHNKVLKEQRQNSCDSAPKLTRREQDVLRWAAKGKTAWETARILKLSEKTISFYISNAAIKLNVPTKTQAVAKSISQHLLMI
tara:strand:- start:1472 stop:2203 length:732 start_codon:yes stop_codon:yes gene_type:complete